MVNILSPKENSSHKDYSLSQKIGDWLIEKICKICKISVTVIQCPKCGSPATSKTSRDTPKGMIWKLRCAKCGHKREWLLIKRGK